MYVYQACAAQAGLPANGSLRNGEGARAPRIELLQEAVRSEVRRRKLQSASRRYTAELAAQVGHPTPRERARAAALAQRIAARADRNAG